MQDLNTKNSPSVCTPLRLAGPAVAITVHLRIREMFNVILRGVQIQVSRPDPLILVPDQ